MQINLILPKLHEAQQYIKDNRKRFTVANCGRRFGKNVLEEDLTAETLLSGYPLGWFAPDYKTLSSSWRSLINTLQPVTKSKSETEHRLEIITGGFVEMWTLENENAGRSRKYKRVIIDEAALVPKLKDIWNNAILPTLLDYAGDAFIGSTPKGRNAYWELYNYGIDPDNKDWKSFHYTTYDNPFISKEEVDLLIASQTELAIKQEIMAEFLEGEGVVFRNIPACMHAPLEVDDKKHKGHRIIAGVDWGKQSDYTAISVGCNDCHVEIARDRFNKIDYHFQRSRLAVLFSKWKINTVLVERNSIGDPNLEELQREGFPVQGFDTTASSKPPLIENLALALERAEWQFQSDPIWTAEMESYERKVSANTGRSSYGAPEGMHDDTVVARALMLRAAEKQATTVSNPFYN